MNPLTQNKRIAWLDVARGMAIIWIVLYHAQVRLNVFPGKEKIVQGTFWSAVTKFFVERGPQAIVILVAVSGFALTMSALKRGRESIGLREYPSWLIRRMARLLPLYWLAHLLFFLACFFLKHPKANAGLGLWTASFFGVHGWKEAWFTGIRGPWWFEGLIIQLSILYPLMAWAQSRLSTFKFLLTAAAVTLLSRFVCVNYLYDWNQYLQQGVFPGCRIFEFALGMAAAKYMWERKTAIKSSTVAILAVVSLAGHIAVSYQGRWLGPYIVMPVLFAIPICILAWSLAVGITRIKIISRPLMWCGILAYPIYLMHGIKTDAQIKMLSDGGIYFGAAIVLVITLTGLTQGVIFHNIARMIFSSFRTARASIFGAVDKEAGG